MISLSCVCVECGWFKFLVFYLFSCASSSFSAIYRSRYHLFFLDNVHSHRSRPPPCFVVSGGWFISKSGSIPSGYSTERSRSLSLSLDFQNFGRKKEKKSKSFFLVNSLASCHRTFCPGCKPLQGLDRWEKEDFCSVVVGWKGGKGCL